MLELATDVLPSKTTGGGGGAASRTASCTARHNAPVADDGASLRQLPVVAVLAESSQSPSSRSWPVSDQPDQIQIGLAIKGVSAMFNEGEIRLC